jgi:hypothetical protein
MMENGRERRKWRGRVASQSSASYEEDEATAVGKNNNEKKCEAKPNVSPSIHPGADHDDRV